jgi:hypothetical protein
MNLGRMGIGDTWMLYGQVFNHPNYPSGSYIYVSTPKEFVNENTIRTFSGRVYALVNPDGNREKIHKEIQEVIEKGGYSRH